MPRLAINQQTKRKKHVMGFIPYSDYDEAEGWNLPPLRDRLAKELADREAREAARLARNAARDTEQANWPERPCCWTVLADALIKTTSTPKELIK